MVSWGQYSQHKIKAGFTRKVALCSSSPRWETQILALVFPNLKDSHSLSRRLDHIHNYAWQKDEQRTGLFLCAFPSCQARPLFK